MHLRLLSRPTVPLYRIDTYNRLASRTFHTEPITHNSFSHAKTNGLQLAAKRYKNLKVNRYKKDYRSRKALRMNLSPNTMLITNSSQSTSCILFKYIIIVHSFPIHIGENRT